MPLWPHHFADDAGEVTAAGNQFHNLVTGLDPRELHRFGGLSILIVLLLFGRAAGIGYCIPDVGGDLPSRVSANRSEQCGRTTGGQESVAKHKFFLLRRAAGAVCPNSPELLHPATAI